MAASGGDDQHAFLVLLGRVDMQEKDLADGRVAVLVFVHVKLGELQHLLDANAGVTKNLDNGEAPEGVFLLLHHVDAVGTARSVRVDRLQPRVGERARGGICGK